MTETPKAPQNPFDVLASFLGGELPKGGHESNHGPAIFDLLAGGKPRGGPGLVNADELFDILRGGAKAGAPKPENHKHEAAEAAAAERPVAKEDTSFQIGLAGVPKENIFVEVQDDVLVIKATVPSDVRVHASREIVREKALPQNVDVERITSTFKDGLLTVNLPAVKPTKVRIDISED